MATGRFDYLELMFGLVGQVTDPEMKPDYLIDGGILLAELLEVPVVEIDCLVSSGEKLPHLAVQY